MGDHVSAKTKNVKPRGGTRIGAVAVLAAMIAVSSPAQEPGSTAESKFRPYAHPVTIWVPPYAVAKSQTELDRSFGDFAIKNAITHVALQFWVPAATGEVARVRNAAVSDERIGALRDWAHAAGIRVMLCVYNGAAKWDWPLARAAFGEHQDAFVQSLRAEVKRLDLDGVDIDLEGPGSFDADKPAFIAFLAKLSGELKTDGKQLTVDTFQSFKWNAPNQSWWPEIFPLVDAIASMGYDDSGLNAPDWRSYAKQKEAAGSAAAKLQIGVPSHKGAWRGNTAAEQLEWIRADGSMGIAIWDAQLQAEPWRDAALWKIIEAIRGTPRP